MPLSKQDNDYVHAVPENSYSRELDSRVQASEMPYGYSYGEPPADTGDFDERSRESKKQTRGKR
jgi:hypothetical protein